MLKFSRNNGTVRYDNRLIRMHVDQVWSADDPFVRARPDLFADEPLSVNRTGEPPIERATARPGEKRTVRKA